MMISFVLPETISWPEIFSWVWFQYVSFCGISWKLWTWKSYRRGYMGWQFLRGGLLQCDLLWHCSSLPFHTLYIGREAVFHLHVCSDFSPSLTSPFLQVGPNQQNSCWKLQSSPLQSVWKGRQRQCHKRSHWSKPPRRNCHPLQPLRQNFQV